MKPVISTLRASDASKVQQWTQSWMDPAIYPLTIFSGNGYPQYIAHLLRLQPLYTSTLYCGVYSHDHELLALVEWRISAKTLFLNNICVAAEYRGAGLGKLIFEHGYRVAAEHSIEQIVLDVFDWNTDAKSWYETLGFVYQSQSYWHTGSFPIGDRVEVTETPILTNYPQAELSQNEFGFSSYQARTSSGEYTIGRINTEVYRLTDQSTLRDHNLLHGLVQLEPNRKLFVVNHEDLTREYPYLTCITTTTRLALKL